MRVRRVLRWPKVSSISRWSYQSIATVWPYLGEDDWSGGVTYGEPYTIACGWAGKAEQRRDSEGAEFTTNNMFWTEASSSGSIYTPVRIPEYRDRIAKGVHTGTWDAADAEEIRNITDWEMAAFEDVPDYEIVT